MTTDCTCVVCGWPAVIDQLCALHAERALDATRTLLGLIDTNEDLRDVRIRQDWVLAVQLAATNTARYLAPTRTEKAA